eukprot:TRINITY_DN5945_c0_g3_i1.p1 TRINITY_DN5945_c0_g3~~TRINITY_DN5945_c0_g3_i1.p1  ORF type:complete len:550 (-),score=152.76 TRINITY_DN5945_c0_g3_i1:27-1676(-)
MQSEGLLFFSKDLLDRFESVRDKVKDHLKICKEIGVMMSDVVSVEEEYIKKLKVIIDRQSAEEKKRLQNSDADFAISLWRLIRKELENNVSQHEQFVHNLTRDGSKAFETYVENAKRERVQADAEFDKAYKSLEKAKESFEKTRQKYVKAGREEAAESKSSVQNEQKIRKAKQELERSELDHKKAVKAYADMDDAYTRYARDELDKCEQLEEARIDELLKLGSAYTTAQEICGRSLQHMSVSTKEALDGFNKAAEIRRFIESLRTGKEPPPKIEFLPLQGFELEADTSSLASRISSKFGRGVDLSSTTTSDQKQSSVDESSQSSSDSSAPASKSRVNQVFSSIASQPLLRSSASILRINTTKSENTASTDEKKATKPNSPPSTPKSPLQQTNETVAPGITPIQRERKLSITTLSMEAISNYDAQCAEDLTLKIGDVVVDVKKDGTEYWTGILRGVRGRFPPACVKVYEPFRGRGPTDPGSGLYMRVVDGINSKPTKYKALYSYTASDDEELSVGEGDVVIVFGEIDGWFFAKDPQGCTGLCPANFFEAI